MTRTGLTVCLEREQRKSWNCGAGGPKSRSIPGSWLCFYGTILTEQQLLLLPNFPYIGY